MDTELNICPYCGDEKPTPHVLVLGDDPYCDECWEIMLDESRHYYDGLRRGKVSDAQ